MTTHDHLPALTDRRAAFVREYTADRNGTAAAIRAGYSERSAAHRASMLLRDPNVRAAIDQREKQIADELGITKHWLLDRMRTVVETALTPTPKTYQGGIVTVPCPGNATVDVVDEDGQLLERVKAEGCDCGGRHTVYEVEGGTAHAALRTLMQHRGMLDEHKRVELDTMVRYEIAGVSLDELT